MKYIFQIIVAAVFCVQVYAQSPFAATFGDSGTDRGVRIIESLNDAGFVVVGLTSSFNSSEEDIYLIKTDEEGLVEWQKTYGGKGRDNGWAIEKTNDNNYIIAGFSNSFAHEDYDYYLTKVSPDGDQLWFRSFGGEGDQYAWDILVARDGNYVMVGQTNGNHLEKLTTAVIKLNDSGEILWEIQLTELNSNRGFSIAESPDGDFFCTGTTTDSVGDINAYAASISSGGQLQWTKSFGGRKKDIGHTVALDNKNNLIIFGYSESYSNTGSSPWLIKLDKIGNLLWSHVYGSDSEERIVAGKVTDENNYLMLGYALHESDYEPNWDLIALSVDPFGNLQWFKTLGGPGNEESGQNLILNSAGEIIFTGRTWSEGKGAGDAFLIKLKNQ